MAAQREVRLYLRAQATVSLAVGALSAFGLWLAGVRSALALGLLTGIFNLIPYLGPVLGAVPTMIAALTSGWQTALFAIVLIIVQQLDGMCVDLPARNGHADRPQPQPRCWWRYLRADARWGWPACCWPCPCSWLYGHASGCLYNARRRKQRAADINCPSRSRKKP